jgi:tetratricopeptide (TPR) repeat protein
MIRKILPLLVLILPTGAQAEWQEASSRHFVVYSDDRPENVRAFTERLEKFDKAIRVFRMAPDDKRGPASRVTVFVVNDVDEIQRIAGRKSIAGFYDPRASGSIAFTPRKSDSDAAAAGMTPQAILFHEYAHHWMLTNWADAALPPWFVEGFAEFHATALFRGDGSVTFGAAPMYRQYTGMRMNLLPARQLLLPDPGKLEGASSDALYSRGWLLTHYLTFDPTRRGQLAKYIIAMNSGKAAEAASILGDPNTLDFKLNAYAKSRSLASVTMKASELPIGPITVRPLGAGESAVMMARLASTSGVTKKTAPKVAELARQLAAPYPNDAAAQNVLAEAEFDAENYTAAEAAADRAIAADPKSIHALVYKSTAQLAAAKKAKVTDPAVWQGARRWLLQANKIDPEDPYPLAEYYYSFGIADETPSKGAEAGMLYAYALAPYDPLVRLSAARILLQQNKPGEARAALAPVAYSRESGQSKYALKILAALDQGGVAAALTGLKEKPDDENEDSDKGKGKDGDKGK